MKLLLLTEFFPASEAVELTGGIEAVCYYLTMHLSRAHDVHVRALRTDGSIWEFTAVRSLPRRIRFLLTTLVASLRDDFDVVEGTNQLLHPIAWIAGRLRRRPVVFLYADVLVGQWHKHFGAAGWLGEIVERVNLRLRPDHVIAISGVVREKLVRAGVPAERISVVPCGFAERLVQTIALEQRPKTTTLITVARLVPYKGVDVVLDAVRRLIDAGFAVTLDVIGQGPELARLQRSAHALGIAERVRFRGHLHSHAEVLRAIAGSRLFVSASRIEGFGIALLEAMALGVPFVASDIDAFREVTGDGEGGHLCRAGDANDMARQIGVLLSDAAAYEAAARAGRERARRYGWTESARATASILAAVCSGQTRRDARRLPPPETHASQVDPAA